MNSFISCLSWKEFISPLLIKNTFAGYSNQGWQLLSSKALNTSFHGLIAFRVSMEESSLNLMGLPLCETRHISLADLSIIFLST
jgi:hypothetical protein